MFNETYETTTQEGEREKVGKVALDLLARGDEKQGVVDTGREMLKDYFDNLCTAALSGKKQYGAENDLYVCVQARRERLLPNVIRNQFYCRQTRPTPQYDLALFLYNPKTDDLMFQWCIPDRETTVTLAYQFPNVDKEHYELASMCAQFVQGKLE